MTMMTIHRWRLLAIGITLLAVLSPARADTGTLTDAAYLVTVEKDFEDVMLDLESAVIDQGLVVDYTGHIGDMLARTGDAVGAASPYGNAQYLQFCSSKLTHAAVAADPANLSICPYVVFAYVTAVESGQVIVGYRRPVGADSDASRDALAEIEALLKAIVDEAGEV